MGQQEAESQIQEIQDSIDALELVLENMSQAGFKNSRAESFHCGAMGKVEMAIDDLNDAMLEIQSYI